MTDLPPSALVTVPRALIERALEVAAVTLSRLDSDGRPQPVYNAVVAHVSELALTLGLHPGSAVYLARNGCSDQLADVFETPSLANLMGSCGDFSDEAGR